MENKLILSPNVIAQQMQEGLCLFHTMRGECHLLNPVAAFLWSCLDAHSQQPGEDGILPETLAQQVNAKYGVSYETALSDVTAFLDEALEADLVVSLVHANL